jgi:hypothetical protein
MVSNYHIIEAQLKNLLGCFRDKKGKEMYAAINMLHEFEKEKS